MLLAIKPVELNFVTISPVVEVNAEDTRRPGN